MQAITALLCVVCIGIAIHLIIKEIENGTDSE